MIYKNSKRVVFENDVKEYDIFTKTMIGGKCGL